MSQETKPHPVAWAIGFFLFTGVTVLLQFIWRSIGSWLLEFLSWFWQRGADSVYAAAATRDPSSMEPIYKAFFFLALFLGLTIFLSYISGQMPTLKISDCSFRFKLFCKLFSLISVCMLFVVAICSALDMASNDVREQFSRKMVYYGPWLSTADDKKLRARFLIIGTEREYLQIMDEMRELAKKKGFPTFPTQAP